MKFGRKLVSSLYADWQEHYLDYNGLKKELKAKSTGKEWNGQDEQRFVKALERNLEKCETFQLSKVRGVGQRMDSGRGKTLVD